MASSMKYTRYCRSVLSTPAITVNRYEKGHRAGADICVLDLEDSIPPAQKNAARHQAQEFFSAPSAAATRCGIRVNTLTSPEGLCDLLAIRRYPVKPAIVVIPKVEAARDVEIAADVLGEVAPEIEFFAVVETPRGLDNASSIVTASGRLRAVIFGAADYSFAVGARRSWDCLLHARAHLVNSARGAGIEVVDAPLFELADAELLEHEATCAQSIGFSGKIAIHPRQIPVINKVFSPDAETIERARQIVAAGEQSERSITVVDGVMVGTPFFKAAQRLVRDFQ